MSVNPEETWNPGFFPLLPLADKIVILVFKGYFGPARIALTEAGYSDADQQIQDLAGFLRFMKEKNAISRVHRYK